MIAKKQTIATILQQHGVSVTKSRLAIFKTLQQADKPIKNGDIAKLTPSVDRASVYRTLELFTTLGITNTLIQGWTPLTELAEPFKDHHHHLLCSGCGRVIDIENTQLETSLRSIASAHSFDMASHSVEITGLCAECKLRQKLEAQPAD